MKYWYLLITILMVGCATPQKLGNNIIQYRKTSCLGKCPVFDLYVYSNGNVIYNGIANVKIKGKHNFHISSTMFEMLRQEILNLTSKTNKTIARDLPKTIIKYQEKTYTLPNDKQLIQFNKLLKQLELIEL